MSLLADMAVASRTRCDASLARVPRSTLEERALAMPKPPPLRVGPRFDVIAECKRRAPSEGVLSSGEADPARAVAERATVYAGAGAAAVSVLTEPDRFDGALHHLEAAARAVNEVGVPAMRKDFLVDPYQVYEARLAGAGGVLVIVRMLDDATLASLLAAASACELFVLLEAFDADDLARASRLVEAWATRVTLLVGVNARDLVTLRVDAGRLARLAPALPDSVPCVAESGLRTPEDAYAVSRLGYRMALVGSALMKAPEPGALVARMLKAGRS